ncbi:hypothetical protein GCM10027168_63360 [Streptomyces capparidis]
MDPQCPRTWGYDRVTARCRKRAIHTVLVYTGDLRPVIDGFYVVCEGHAIGAEACVDVRVILGT